jgi:acetyltransferase
MSIRHLDRLFRPQSIAVIGASDQPPAIGYLVMRNLLNEGFAGPIMPVNPKHKAVAGVLCYPDVGSLPETPDLAIICTPAPTVPDLIGQLGARGTKAAAVFSAGLGRGTTPDGKTYQQAMLDAAKPHLLRVLGPNSIGLLVPGSALNASFAHVGATSVDPVDCARLYWIGRAGTRSDFRTSFR